MLYIENEPYLNHVKIADFSEIIPYLNNHQLIKLCSKKYLIIL